MHLAEKRLFAKKRIVCLRKTFIRIHTPPPLQKLMVRPLIDKCSKVFWSWLVSFFLPDPSIIVEF